MFGDLDISAFKESLRDLRSINNMKPTIRVSENSSKHTNRVSDTSNKRIQPAVIKIALEPPESEADSQ